MCCAVRPKGLVAQLCLTLCDPMDCILPGSSVHGILQVRILEWGAIAFSDEVMIRGQTKGTKLKKKSEKESQKEV